MAARKMVLAIKGRKRAERNDAMTKRVMQSGADSSAVFWKQVIRRRKGGIQRLCHKGKVADNS